MRASSILVVGSSNSGKSTVVKRASLDLKKPIFVVGDQTYSEEEKKIYQPLSWEDVLDASNCVLIFEDVLSLTKAQDKILRTVLDIHKHHKDVTSFVLAHRVQGVGLFNVVSSFDEVWVTVAKSNVRSLDQILQYFRYSEAERRQQIKDFNANTASFGHLSIDTKTREIKLHKQSSEEAKKEPENPLQFELLPKGSLELHKLIFRSIPDNLINSRDQTISLKNKRTGEIKVCSIYDYLYYLKVQRRPTKSVLAMHKFVLRNLNMPDFIVTNSYLKKKD